MIDGDIFNKYFALVFSWVTLSHEQKSVPSKNWAKNFCFYRSVLFRVFAGVPQTLLQQIQMGASSHRTPWCFPERHAEIHEADKTKKGHFFLPCWLENRSDAWRAEKNAALTLCLRWRCDARHSQPNNKNKRGDEASRSEICALQLVLWLDFAVSLTVLL